MWSKFFRINTAVEYKNFLWACCEGALICLIKTLNIKLSIFNICRFYFGAGGRNRTDMDVKPGGF